MSESTTFHPFYYPPQIPSLQRYPNSSEEQESNLQIYPQIQQNHYEYKTPSSAQGLSRLDCQQEPYQLQPQYTYAPTFQPINQFNESSPPFLTSSQLSSSPISPSFSIPIEYYQSYPSSGSLTGTSIQNLSSSPPSLPEVAKIDHSVQFGFNPSLSQQPSTSTIEGSQMMTRGHTWPFAYNTIEGRLQGLELHSNSNNLWQNGAANNQVKSGNLENNTQYGSQSNSIPPVSSSKNHQANQLPFDNPPTISQTPIWNTTSSTITPDYTSATTPSTIATRNSFSTQPVWQSFQSPTAYDYRPSNLIEQVQRYTPISATFSQSPINQTHKPRTIPTVPLGHSVSLPFIPAFVVRPSLEMLTTKVTRPKRRLPTPPRVSGWIPPEQRPIPSGNLGEECRPRMLPIPPPPMLPSSSTKQEGFAEIQPTSSVIYPGTMTQPDQFPSLSKPVKHIKQLECDTSLPQVQSQPQVQANTQLATQQQFPYHSSFTEQNQNTFAFAMSNPPMEDTKGIIPSQPVVNSVESSTSNIQMPFSVQSITRTPLTSTSSSDSRGYNSSSRRDLLTKAPLAPNLPRPGSEPNPRRGRPKSGKRPSTGISTLERRARMEIKMINSVGKRFICPECDEPFTRRNDLERHTRSKHTHETPFQCPGCEKAFSRKDKLDQHIEKSPVCRAIAPPREERVRRRRGKIEPPIYRYDPRLHNNSDQLSSNPPLGHSNSPSNLTPFGSGY